QPDGVSGRLLRFERRSKRVHGRPTLRRQSHRCRIRPGRVARENPRRGSGIGVPGAPERRADFADQELGRQLVTRGAPSAGPQEEDGGACDGSCARGGSASHGSCGDEGGASLGVAARSTGRINVSPIAFATSTPEKAVPNPTPSTNAEVLVGAAP